MRQVVLIVLMSVLPLWLLLLGRVKSKGIRVFLWTLFEFHLVLSITDGISVSLVGLIELSGGHAQPVAPWQRFLYGMTMVELGIIALIFYCKTPSKKMAAPESRTINEK